MEEKRLVWPIEVTNDRKIVELFLNNRSKPISCYVYMCCCCCCSLVNVFFAANDIKQISNFYLRNIDLYSFDFSLFVCRCMNQIIKFGYIWKTCKDRNQENYLIEWSWFWLYSSDFSVCFNAWTSSAIKANPAICGVLWIPQVGIRWTIYGWKYCSVLQLKAKNKIHKAKQIHTQKKTMKTR